MISNMKKGDHIALDETSCGPMCQHPACWQSNTRREKGFPKMMEKVHPVPDIELGKRQFAGLNISTFIVLEVFETKFSSYVIFKDKYKQMSMVGFCFCTVRQKSIYIMRNSEELLS